MARIRRTIFAVTAGAAGAYFLDPEQGARRRNEAQDRARAFLRRQSREAAQKARYAEGVARGAAYSGDDTEPGELDDVTLARKVESEIFRDADVPKGKLNVNAEDGVVYLRGEVDSEDQIEALVEATRKVAGVRGVKNLLHLPGAEPPAKEEAETQSAEA
jgi:osmotically-inducible protein OsmY